jgi:hypothetical protein
MGFTGFRRDLHTSILSPTVLGKGLNVHKSKYKSACVHLSAGNKFWREDAVGNVRSGAEIVT